MNSKINEQDLMAYLYGEMEGEEKAHFEQLLRENPELQAKLEGYRQVSKVFGKLEDKEVIAPPIFVGDPKRRFIWDAPYFKTIVSIAASLILLILVGRVTGTKVSYSGNEFRLAFGGTTNEIQDKKVNGEMSAEQVQKMINESLAANNVAVNENLRKSQELIDASIKKNLAQNSGRIDKLVQEAAKASQSQINQYVAGLQSENMQVVKDYFQLTSTEQKKYIENLLVDFAQYMQQQRNNDLQVVQTQLNSLQQNTDIFKQETEQILTSIISTVGNSPATKETNN